MHIFSILYILLLFALVATFVFIPKLAYFLRYIIVVALVFFVLIGFSTVLFPSLYRNISNSLLENSGMKTNIINTQTRINDSLTNLSEAVKPVSSIINLLDPNKDNSENKPKQVNLEQSIYNPIVNLVSTLIRIFVAIFCLVGITVLTLLRFTYIPFEIKKELDNKLAITEGEIVEMRKELKFINENKLLENKSTKNTKKIEAPDTMAENSNK